MSSNGISTNQEVGSMDIECDAGKVQEAIDKLRDLVLEDKNLKVKTDDKFMLRYLRSNEFKPKEAFDKMVKVYKFKSKHKQYFCNEPVTKYKDIILQNFVTLLEDRDQIGRRIFLAKLGDLDTENLNILDCIKLNDWWLELAMDEEETQKSGVVFLLDLGGIPLRLVKFFTSKHTIVSASKEEMRPWKSIDIHVVNTSKFIDTLVSFVYPVLGAKLKQHIHFHGQDWISLHKFLDPKVLPQEYGGLKTGVDYTKMQQYLFDNENKLMELFSFEYIKT